MNQCEVADGETPDETLRRFAQENPDRARAMNGELAEIDAGRFRPVELSLDPLTAYWLAGAIDLATSHPRFPETPRPAMDRIYQGLAERIAPQFPELARQLAEGYQQRREQVRTSNAPDSTAHAVRPATNQSS